MGAWIEIDNEWFDIRNDKVAPLVGAWIEIPIETDSASTDVVAPLVGAWIEIYLSEPVTPSTRSLLSWERGLKFAGYREMMKRLTRRSSRGSVD